MKIIILADSPGTADMFKPVWPFLFTHHDCQLITTHPSATKILSQSQPIYCTDLVSAKTIYDNIKPDLVVTGISSILEEPHIINELTKIAAIDGRATIALQDYWANHRTLHNRPMLNYWRAVLVPDQLSRDYLLADNYAGEIIVTGHPGWEKCLAAEPVGAKDNEFVLLWAGSATPGGEAIDEESFLFLLAALATIIPTPGLIVRPHPRDEAPARYERLAREAGVTLRPPAAGATDVLLPSADVVLATYSTSLIHAALMKIPAVSLMLPTGGQTKMQAANLSDFPLNQIGAALGVYQDNPNTLAQILIKLRDDDAYRVALRAKQEAFAATLPTQAARNVATAILNFDR